VTTPVLAVEGLTAGYDNSAVIRNIDLTVSPGEIVALLGPNGAGKTTTMRAISGLVRAKAGMIYLAGEPISSRSPSERAVRGIAHVPEGRGLFFGLTVAEHFRLGHRGEHLDAEVAFGYFPVLAKLASRPAGVLSGGEQQMLAVGRALARRPRLMLLDELSLGLAPVIVEELLPVIHSYAAKSRCGVLLVEQHVHLGLTIADRGYILVHGEIRMERPAEILRADHRLLAASYLGGQPGDRDITNDAASAQDAN
jgi:branched-chain amino acid transport system ATP-binding protein